MTHSYNPLDHVGSDENIISMDDVRKAIAALEREREACRDAVTDRQAELNEASAEHVHEYQDLLSDAQDELKKWEEGEDTGGLLAKLIDLENEVDRRSADCLINDDHFMDYAKRLADDLHGTKVTEAEWPFDHIDWEEAAETLKQDYTQVEYDGVTFYYRS